MICPTCERQNPADNAFCGGCGDLLRRGTGAPARRDPGSSPEHLAEKRLFVEIGATVRAGRLADAAAR